MSLPEDAIRAIEHEEWTNQTRRRITEPVSARGQWARAMTDQNVPWWAIALLDLDHKSPQGRVRMDMMQGRRTTKESYAFWEAWADCIEWAQQRVMKKTMDEWLDAAREDCDPKTMECGPVAKVVRDAALMSVRPFGQFIHLTDDEGLPIVFKDFHVAMVRAMRNFSVPSCILVPLEHGKSYISSIVVPLMDYAEWNDGIQVRVYLNQEPLLKWIRRLMGIIETNERLHKIFPWIRKPIKGDPGHGIWSSKGFALGGRSLPDKSFEPLTVGKYSTGLRAARVGCDDWVTTGNCDSKKVQEKLWDYMHTGPMTIPQALQRRSPHGTKWGTFFLCGTLFGPSEVNYKAYLEFKNLDYHVKRIDVFVQGREERGVIWPEYRDMNYIMAMKRRLTERVFNMRCRNIIRGTKDRRFDIEKIKHAEHDGTHGDEPFEWRVVPDRTRLTIGFDPGSGKITKDSKNPAFCVYGARDSSEPFPGTFVPKDPYVLDPNVNPTEENVFHHIIEWGRLENYSFTRQCDKLIELAEHYNCSIAVEDNGIGAGYQDYINRTAKHIQVYSLTTSQNKRDPRDGVDQFEPLFEHERVIIHAKNAPQQTVLDLRDELFTYPGPYTDIVMAMWVARHQYQLASRGEASNEPIEPQIPEYGMQFIEAFGSYLDN